MTGLQRLKAVGEFFYYNYQSGDVANHTIDNQALYDDQAVLELLFVLSTVFSKVVLKRALKSMTGGLASASRAAAKTRTSCNVCRWFAGFFADYPEPFCCLHTQSLQADRLEHEVGQSASRLVAWSWPTDWQGCQLRRLGRTSLNVRAFGVCSSPFGVAQT